MATAAQTSANRANAQKSTGPRTPEGKAKVAQNAVKHGLLVQEVVVKGEDPEEFACYRDQMLEELAPAGPTESMLAARIIGLSWRLQRAERLQAGAFDTLEDQQKPAKPIWSDKGWEVPQPAKLGPEEEARALGRRVAQDFAGARILDRLLVYERRIEGSLYRTMAELEKRQRLRRERETGQEGEEGSGRYGGASREPPADFTLDNLLAALAVLEETPDGATTNAPADPSCETKPISEGVSSFKWQVSSEDGSAKCEVSSLKSESPAAGPPRPATSNLTLHTSNSPSGVTTNAEAEGPSCETKPVSEEVSSFKCDVSSLEEKQVCETKPIPASADGRRVSYTPIFRRRR